MKTRTILRAFCFLALLAASLDARAYESPQIAPFIDEMVAKYGFQRGELEQLMGQAQYKQSIIDAITSPATLKPWAEYRDNFINEFRITGGIKFWRQNAEILRRAEAQYGVPQEILVALLGVETFYGKNTGSYRAVDALSTLAFDYPARAPFFRSELVEYLLLAREQKYAFLTIKGSYAGALGMPQFMPSNYRRLAVDFDGDGVIDLWNSRADIIGSVANYLHHHGWVAGEPVALRARISANPVCPGDISTPRPLALWAAYGIAPAQPTVTQKSASFLGFALGDEMDYWLTFDNFQVLRAYNTSNYYAMSILQLSEELHRARTW